MIDPEAILRPASPEEYQRYIEFASSEPNPWRADHLSELVVVLGAESAVSQEEASGLKACYEAPYRSYHGEPHGNYMGQVDMPDALVQQLSPAARGQAGAVLAVAGLFHDAVYKHVDAPPDGEEGAWHPFISGLVDEVARYSLIVENNRPVFRTHLTDMGRQDRATNMVAQVFGFDHAKFDQGITTRGVMSSTVPWPPPSFWKRRAFHGRRLWPS